MLIRVFLHVKFISAMKPVQNPTIFKKNAKNRKIYNLGNIHYFFEIFNETLEQNITQKSENMFLDVKEDK